jgi:tripartite-type tricarboxylate transporter receptor subunit TctC
VIIENRPGAATNIAAQNVISSPADGYSLLWIGTSNAINASLYQNLPFNFVRDVAPVAGMVVYPLVLEVHPSVAATNLAQFIALAKATPGRINYGSYGTGTTSHVAGELFKTMAGINMVHVPYRGGAPAITDLLGGQVQVYFGPIPESIEHIRAGTLRPLAVTTAIRLEVLPDIPTVAEFVQGYVASDWHGVGAPTNTPREIVERLSREISAALADPKIKARFADIGGTVLVGSSADFGKLIADETEKWGKVVKFAGLTPQ